ncbi:hypothetical protein [Microbacterium sp.]|uniref:hypothetical protein n=1 Tax=Microbacterium sp. TaxID=51671 RepID=UPI003A95107C
MEPVEGVYASIPTCRPDDWLHAVEAALSVPEVEQLRRRLRVAGRSTVLRACRIWAAAADHRTGRDVAVSHQTVAEAIGYAEATVKRIVRFLSRLGLLVECARGRNRLSMDELHQARQLGATQQRAVASTRALTIPRSVYGTPLPTSGTVNEKSPVKKFSPRRALRARKAGAAPRPALNEGVSAGSSQRHHRPEVSRFAAQLVNALPRLLWTATKQPRRTIVTLPGGGVEVVWEGGRHIGQVCDAIKRHELIERGWTVQRILERVSTYRAEARIIEPEPSAMRDGLDWFFWLIQRAIGKTDLAPAKRAEIERAEHAAEAAARRAADAERRARLDEQQEEIQAAIAALHAQFPRRPKARRPFA